MSQTVKMTQFGYEQLDYQVLIASWSLTLIHLDKDAKLKTQITETSTTNITM